MMDPMAVPPPGYHPSPQPSAMSPDPVIDPSLAIDPAILGQACDPQQVGTLAAVRWYIYLPLHNCSFVVLDHPICVHCNVHKTRRVSLRASCSSLSHYSLLSPILVRIPSTLLRSCLSRFSHPNSDGTGSTR